MVQKEKRNNCHRNKNRLEKKQMVNNLKKSSGCQSCGIKNPVVLQFHHREKESKTKSISMLVAETASLERIAKEIEKCVILCANCHLILHDEERKEIVNNASRKDPY